MLKIQNTCKRTIFGHVSGRIDAVMHAKGLGSKFAKFHNVPIFTTLGYGPRKG
jgi:hypothetical protein